MRSSRWYGVLVAGLWANTLHAHLLQVDSTKCEIYSYRAIPCKPPEEYRGAAPASFVVFADSTCGGYYCPSLPWPASTACVEQITKLLPDSLFIHAYAYAQLDGAESQARSKSSASITLRVDPGHPVRYYIAFSEWVQRDGIYGGTATASFALTSSGRVIQSFRLQAGPGLPYERVWSDGYSGVLEPGEYVLEAQSSADPFPSFGSGTSELYLALGLHEGTTPIVPTSWGATKSLYQ